jgi:hypothetical protein
MRVPWPVSGIPLGKSRLSAAAVAKRAAFSGLNTSFSWTIPSFPFSISSDIISSVATNRARRQFRTRLPIAGI